jgi:hypothetical protein
MGAGCTTCLEGWHYRVGAVADLVVDIRKSMQDVPHRCVPAHETTRVILMDPHTVVSPMVHRMGPSLRVE